jgi:hypothetical protein
MQASLQYAQMKVQYKSKAVVDTLLNELGVAVAERMKDKESAEDSRRKKDAAPDFPMHYSSFVVEYTSHLTLSAADHVHIVWAHLQNTKHKLCSKMHEGFWCELCS